MKIRSVRIDSFGGKKDLGPIDLDEGMNVIYGENESGKTTLMEFIRGTLIPVTGRTKTYPARDKKGDSGYVSVRMDDDSEMIVRKEGNTSKFNMDPVIYRSIYAMTSDDLRDSEIITSGNIKSSFLTVPGGERLPGIIKSIDDEMKEMLTPSKMSDKTAIGRTISDIDSVGRNLNTSYDECEYDELYSEHFDLTSKLNALRTEEVGYDKVRQAWTLKVSQNDNVNNRDIKKQRIAELSPSLKMTDEVVEKKKELENAVRSAYDIHSDAERNVSDSQRELKNMDHKKVLAQANRIDRLKERISEMNELLKEDEHNSHIINNDYPRQQNGHNRSIGMILVIIGAFAALAGYMLDMPIAYMGGLLIALGILQLFSKGKNKVIKTDITATGPRHTKARIDALNKDLEHVKDYIGMTISISFEYDVNALVDILEKSKVHDRNISRATDSDRELKDLQSNLRSFLANFGGEEGFINLLKDRDERIRLETEVSTLEGSIKNSGYYQDEKDLPDVPDKESIMEEISRMSLRLGQIDADMKAIRDDTNIEGLMDRRAKLWSELMELTRRWGMLSLASKMIDSACNELYSEMQPSVITTANRYLASMTHDRYGLIIDPRSSDISVTSNNGSKTEEQWSTGLGDQIKLSIKLAIAEELPGETMPILLDDVLLTFDSKRKRGGCRTLMDASKNMQVILFTCDKETRDLMIEEGCKKVIEL